VTLPDRIEDYPDSMLEVKAVPHFNPPTVSLAAAIRERTSQTRKMLPLEM
jgi:hypothetical protein